MKEKKQDISNLDDHRLPIKRKQQNTKFLNENNDLYEKQEFGVYLGTQHIAPSLENSSQSSKRQKMQSSDHPLANMLDEEYRSIQNDQPFKDIQNKSLDDQSIDLNANENLTSLDNLKNKLFNQFNKQEYVKISELQLKYKEKIKNRLSDKLSRRDVTYYDLYKHQKPQEEFQKMRMEWGYPFTVSDGKIKELYGDMAYDEYNIVFQSHGDIVKKQFGQTIQVNLTVKNIEVQGSQQQLSIDRHVIEDMSLKQNIDAQQYSRKQGGDTGVFGNLDEPDLQNVDSQLKILEEAYQKSRTEMADIYCKVSGKITKVRQYLQYEKQQKDLLAQNQGLKEKDGSYNGSQQKKVNQNVQINMEGSGIITWNYLEDLALQKPDDSPEFKVLLALKGKDEIIGRRDFLGVKPLYKEQPIIGNNRNINDQPQQNLQSQN